MKKNIWVINQFAGNPKSGWGERHYFFSKYWIRKGYNVSIISGSFNHVFKTLPTVKKNFEVEYYDSTRFCWVKVPHYNPKSIFRFWSFLIFSLKLIFLPISKIGKPDIIIVSSMPIFPILTAFFLKVFYSSKALFFEIRDLWPLTLIHLGKKSINHPAVKFIAWFEKFGYRKSDKIISLLPNAKNHFEKVAEAGEKFIYIPNGLDHSVLKPEKLPDYISSKIPKSKFIIGYTGTIGLANALEFFVDAAILLKNDNRFHFIIIGDGYLKDELVKRSYNLKNINLFSKISKNQVSSAVKKFDICFVGRNNSPLFKHGVSANKYFDYMIEGKPILDSNNFIKDPVELSGCGIIVKPDCSKSIVDGILKFYKMTKEERTQMGNLGKYYVSKNHSIKYLSEKYINLFKNY